MKTATSIIKIYPNVIDPKTNQPLRSVMWPAINQVFEETTASVVIKLEQGCIRLYDKRDLLQFGKWDIHQLSIHQIMVAEDIFDPAAKEYTTVVADIIQKEMWYGAMGTSDVLVVDKD
ncbi:hypothetical protein Lser_V15G19703 [Lactuca serriola]